MKTKTRFKLTVIAGIFLGCLTIIATLLKMEVVATTCIAGIMTILSAYIWAQTKRPSTNETADNDTGEQTDKEYNNNSVDSPRITYNRPSWALDDPFNEGEESIGKDTGADGSGAKADKNKIRRPGFRK
ncbi:MAG: hypothetical protein KGP35_06765 [Bacteroidetes bacterium]|nr:hypothetical protein [Bacteroidota bacterium]